MFTKKARYYLSIAMIILALVLPSIACDDGSNDNWSECLGGNCPPSQPESPPSAWDTHVQDDNWPASDNPVSEAFKSLVCAIPENELEKAYCDGQ